MLSGISESRRSRTVLWARTVLWDVGLDIPLKDEAIQDEGELVTLKVSWLASWVCGLSGPAGLCRITRSAPSRRGLRHGAVTAVS